MTVWVPADHHHPPAPLAGERRQLQESKLDKRGCSLKRRREVIILPPSQMDISISIRQPKQEGKGEKDDIIITFRPDKDKYVHLSLDQLTGHKDSDLSIQCMMKVVVKNAV